jgi:hypothetical protein
VNTEVYLTFQNLTGIHLLLNLLGRKGLEGKGIIGAAKNRDSGRSCKVGRVRWGSLRGYLENNCYFNNAINYVSVGDITN